MDAKQEMIDRLKGKTAKDYRKEYVEAEQKLIESLSELPNWSDECKCEDCEECKIIYEGEFSEIQVFCLNCGGYIIEREW